MRVRIQKLICALLCVSLLTAFAAASGTRLPILMYHDITSDPAAVNSMTVTEERFRLDMEFLQQYGYTALLPTDLLDIRQGMQPMPDKPIMVTFDDGYLSNYTLAYPVLQQTGLKAALAVVAANIQTDDYATEDRHILTWGELRDMSESGVFEIGLHTYNLHNPQYAGMTAPDGIDGVQRLRGETQSAYSARVGSDLSIGLSLLRQYTGQQTVNYFSYPFGAYDSWMPPLLAANNVGVSTLTNPGVADLSGGLHRLPRYRIEMNRSVAELLQQTDTAVPALAKVEVNGVLTTLPAYNINGSNFVRVRDVAKLLAGTSSGFDVQWNQPQYRVELTSFASYTPLGSEGAPLPQQTLRVQSLTQPTVVDDKANLVAAYNIGGNTFYKLRSLGDLCGFLVDWDETSQTIVVIS